MTIPSIDIPPERRIFCARTLNLRAIAAIGYDMDYTLVHYRPEQWELRAYEKLKQLLAQAGWPVGGLSFDPASVIRGLIIDCELGNVVKANRFGYVMRAAHGTRLLGFDEQREVYRHQPVDLGDRRFYFLNTLFSLSECCLYSQLVDLLDARRLPGVMSYADLFRRVQEHLDQAHMEGSLKAEILESPSVFIEPDPDAALTLLDQANAGKRLLLITNAEWSYTRSIMAYAFDPYLPKGMIWRDLFELVIVRSRKPSFFAHDLQMFRIVNEDEGLLRPLTGPIVERGAYLGGDAGKVEEYLGLSGDAILYVGDHIFADVRMSKSILRWRTALILRELEDELRSLASFSATERRLAELMAEKTRVEEQHSRVRLELLRLERAYGPPPSARRRQLEVSLDKLWACIEELDAEVAPLARQAVEVSNPRWGLLLRAGNDKSHLARQVEGSADIYTSRVSNFLRATPYAYLRSVRGSMPHDP
jgi:5'-nucleotidase